MFFEVTDAEYVADYQLRLFFLDGSVGVADLSSYPDRNNVFRPLLDPEVFRGFRVECGTLLWSDGSIDIAPEKLYELATGKPVRYPTSPARNS